MRAQNSGLQSIDRRSVAHRSDGNHDLWIGFITRYYIGLPRGLRISLQLFTRIVIKRMLRGASRVSTPHSEPCRPSARFPPQLQRGGHDLPAPQERHGCVRVGPPPLLLRGRWALAEGEVECAAGLPRDVVAAAVERERGEDHDRARRHGEHNALVGAEVVGPRHL